MSYLRIRGMCVENIILIFEINTLEFAEIQKYIQKGKTSNLGPKILNGAMPKC